MKYVCSICGFVYDESAGIPEAGIAPGTKWEQLPENWVCPLCGASKAEFNPQQEATETKHAVPVIRVDTEDMRELTFGERSILCSNLSRGCEKQYLSREAELFAKLADYYKARTPVPKVQEMDVLWKLVEQDLSSNYPGANAAAQEAADRGAKRALLWSEKVTRMLGSLLARCEKEGTGFVEKTNVYVCDICGFIYVGDTPPEICPVCKVPRFKILKVQRG